VERILCSGVGHEALRSRPTTLHVTVCTVWRPRARLRTARSLIEVGELAQADIGPLRIPQGQRPTSTTLPPLVWIEDHHDINDEVPS